MHNTEIIEHLSFTILDSKKNSEMIDKASIDAGKFCNEAAVYTAKEFLRGNFDFVKCDYIMNNIHAFIFANIEFFNSGLPEPANSIYEAFDLGEYFHQNDNKTIDPVFKYTRPLLKEIVGNI